jgi:hypothetical protein
MFIHYGGRMIVVTAQIFRACYFTQKIQSSSEQFVHDLYDSEWISATLKYKKVMLTFNENLKVPIKLRILKTFHVNLETFQAVRWNKNFTENFKSCSYA